MKQKNFFVLCIRNVIAASGEDLTEIYARVLLFRYLQHCEISKTILSFSVLKISVREAGWVKQTVLDHRTEIAVKEKDGMQYLFCTGEGLRILRNLQEPDRIFEVPEAEELLNLAGLGGGEEKTSTPLSDIRKGNEDV